MGLTNQRGNFFWLLVFYFAHCFFISSCSTKPQTIQVKMTCDTTYPILLIHGLGLRDRSGLFSYWGDIPKVLTRHGASVFTGNQDAFGTLTSNAELLKQRIEGILRQTGSKKINLIAHSKGGLEARYLISKLEMANRVASLTTIATPHQGSSMADIILEKIPGKHLSRKVIDLYWKLMGDKEPDSLRAGQNLSVAFMKRFNEEVINAPGIYYQSYGAAIDETYPNPIWRKLYTTLKKEEGENDGLVSVDSCQWGDFKGIVTSNGQAAVSHADIVGLTMFSGVTAFDAEAFFLTIVRDLKQKGF